MHFFNYSFKKILVSPSTYITLIIAVSIPWILAFNEGAGYFLPIIIFFTMPLFVIFITYTAGKIFRDEIENQTMLSILSKPLKRSSLIFEGYLAVITWVLIGSLVISLMPGFVVAIKEKSSFIKPVLMTLALDLLGAIFSSVALMLSLVLKGKSFVGVMLGAFGSGFYLLFGFSSFMQMRYSNAQKINPISIANKINNKNIKLTLGGKNSNLLLTAEKNTNDKTKKLEELYNEIKALKSKKAPYDVIKWFDPSMHWGAMFGSYKNSEDKINEHSESDILSRVFEAKEFKIVNLSEMKNDQFTFEIKQTKLVPIWYPFVLWTTIGSGLILLSLFKINKINIT